MYMDLINAPHLTGNNYRSYLEWRNGAESRFTDRHGTIVGVTYNGGTVLRADSRTGTGMYVANGASDKIA
uniref:Uncharacterized protein n=1 Tax=Picea sitchensis TaxID=3332 RepID=A9NWY9_PICSI|nr:unknown [Picea sitchensis]